MQLGQRERKYTDHYLLDTIFWNPHPLSHLLALRDLWNASLHECIEFPENIVDCDTKIDRINYS